MRSARSGDIELVTTQHASVCVPGTHADPGLEWLLLDTVQQYDGLEKLVVIAVGLDATIDYDESTLETRSGLYRALTRAQMMTLVQ